MSVNITAGEKKVLDLIYLTDKQIAQKLILAVPTVKTYIHKLFIKYKAKNRTELLYKVMQDKDRRIVMLSINDINLLKSQNECLKKQNQDLQKELQELKQMLEKVLKNENMQ